MRLAYRIYRASIIGSFVVACCATETRGEESFQVLPADTYPYLIRIQGRDASGLQIKVNEIPVASELSLSGYFDYGVALPFLRNNQSNVVHVSSDSSTSVNVLISRGDKVVCSFSFPSTECLFDASVAYQLVDDPPQTSVLSCADSDFMNRFFDTLEPYQKAHALNFFSIDQDRLDADCGVGLEISGPTIAALFLAAPSPREALHAPLGVGRSITLVTRRDVALDVSRASSLEMVDPVGVLIFEFAGTRRVLPILDPRDAYIMMTQTS